MVGYQAMVKGVVMMVVVVVEVVVLLPLLLPLLLSIYSIKWKPTRLGHVVIWLSGFYTMIVSALRNTSV
ncbi:hypothetical protein BD289DRAFT_447171, partial [Coniella lustricola]